MKNVVLFPLFLLSLLSTITGHAAEHQTAVLDAEFWVMPRNGEKILNNEAIIKSVAALREDADAYLVIHHPESEFGELWGEELQGWLISLAVSADRIELRPGYEGEGVALVIVSADVEPDGHGHIFDIPVVDVEGRGELILDAWNSQYMLSNMLENEEEEAQSAEPAQNNQNYNENAVEETAIEVPVSQGEVELE